MKVSELIEQLQKCTPDKEVVFITDDGGFCVGEVIGKVIEYDDHVSLF